MIIVVLLVIVILFLLWCYYRSTENYNYWKKKGVIFQKPVPFFGNIKDIALCKLTQAECLQNIYREYSNEKYVGIFQLGTPTLLVRDPELIKQFLVKDFKHFTDRGFVFDEKKEPLTANLVNLGATRWKLLRQKLTPTFSTLKIKSDLHTWIIVYQGRILLAESIVNICTVLILIIILICDHHPRSLYFTGDDALARNHGCRSSDINISIVDFFELEMLNHEEVKCIEIRELTAKFTTDVIGSCAFGLQFNSMSETSSEFRKMGYKALQPSKLFAISKLIRVFFPKLFRILNLRTFPKEVNHFFLSVVEETLKQRENNNFYRNDFMQLLFELKKSSDLAEAERELQIELTDNLIAAQAFVFFLAGFETSSTTLSFCLHELAVNQSVQTEVFEEINTVAEKNGLPFDYEALKEMNFLEQCLLETMRKYPPVQALARICTKSYVIQDTNIRLDEGAALLIPVYAIHHDAQYYPDPEKFHPDRFSGENLSQKQNGIYMPFGDGPRICIGMRFAMMEMKLALATFLYHYKVTLCERSSHPLQLDPASFILAPKDGIWLNVTNRNFPVSKCFEFFKRPI